MQWTQPPSWNQSPCWFVWVYSAGVEVEVVPATISWDKIRRGRCGTYWNESGCTNSYYLALTNSMNCPAPSFNSPTTVPFPADLGSWPSQTTALWANLVIELHCLDPLTQSPLSAFSVVGQCMQNACNLLWNCSRNTWIKQGSKPLQCRMLKPAEQQNNC